MEIKNLTAKYSDEIIRNRREFHRIPESSGREFKTSALIRQKLLAMGLTPQSMAGTGLVAEIAGARAGKTVALRSDMDALPLAEKTGAAYCSQHEGFMHACGHDAHIAMLLGAARMLLDLRQEIRGGVRLIFQPAEENSAGARAMIAEGVLHHVDTIFGLHVWSGLDAGTISVEAGPRMASADFWYIDIRGKGGHGGMPHDGIDALIAGAALVNSLQTVVSREISPLEPGVLSIGEFRAGALPNIIADSAFLSGTSRAFNPLVREQFPAAIKRIAEHTAAAYRAEIKLRYDFGSPAVENDPACSEIAERAARKVMGEQAPVLMEKTMGGEDFADYQQTVPGVFAFLGIRNGETGAYPQHSPFYTLDESVLPHGAAVAVQYALDFQA
ncbi:MAG: amidohydrolase [Treponema sp.]|jgi:amidohydrolase|nr:amidohydrolase [Treponema sp.]